MFVRDRVTQRTRRVSVSSRGAQANRMSGGYPSISPDGRYVAFESLASNLVVGDRNKSMDVFVHDRKAGYTILASLGVRGNQGNTWASIGVGSALSANGRDVVFSSPAPNLVPRDTNGAPDVFVRDFGGRPAR
jgi:Tol biopolymer transport system component